MRTVHALILTSALVIVCSSASAQTDTTWREFYPLGLGDLWQYTGPGGGIGTRYVAAIDTLMPNGQRYARMQSREYPNSFWFERLDTNGWVQFYAPTWGDTCGGHHELNYFRLREPVGSFWKICPNLIATLNPPPYFFRFDGTFIRILFGAPREVMQFSPGDIRIETGDTIFYSLQWWLVRGIGLYSTENLEFGGLTYLRGAIINGVQYGTIVAVEDMPATIPAGFALHQNYPNPFNPTTTIRYELPERNYVNLRVYNILGQEVSRLVDESQAPGRYEVGFDATRLPSGAYLTVLQAGTFRSSRWMVLIK